MGGTAWTSGDGANPVTARHHSLSPAPEWDPDLLCCLSEVQAAQQRSVHQMNEPHTTCLSFDRPNVSMEMHNGP